MRPGQAANKFGKIKHDDEMSEGGGQREQRQSRTARHPQRSGQPDRGCRRQTSHDVAAQEDHAATDEADPGYHLRGDTRGVEHNPTVREYVHEAVFRDQHDQCGGYPDKGVCSKPRAFLANLPLHTYQGGQDKGERQLRELQPSLTGEIQKSCTRGSPLRATMLNAMAVSRLLFEALTGRVTAGCQG
jgi:hypothetical protein